MRMTKRLTLLAAAIAMIGVACSSEASPDEIVLLTHSSFALSEGTLEAFTEDTGVTVVVQDGGDAGTMLNQAILTKDNPIADVIFGVDNTFLSRAIDEGIFAAHEAEGIDAVSDLIHVDGHMATAIDYGDVCINYDIEGLAALDVPPPTSLEDLTNPTYRDMLVVEDPATSSPGLAFLLATISAYPDGSAYDWTDYWGHLFDNGVSVASDWSEAYYGEFTRAGGDRPLVVSYASSPPAEVFFGELDEAPTGVMTEGCFRQIEFAGVLAGTEHQTIAGKLVDFLLSVEVQEDIPLNMFVYPANGEAALPEVFEAHTTFPEVPTIMDPTSISANRDAWIEQWTAIARS